MESKMLSVRTPPLLYLRVQQELLTAGVTLQDFTLALINEFRSRSVAERREFLGAIVPRKTGRKIAARKLKEAAA